jgi:rod shape-determining protein MreB
MSIFGKKVGIDLGTANSIVYVEGEGVVLMEPTVVAIDVNKYRDLEYHKDWFSKQN